MQRPVVIAIIGNNIQQEILRATWLDVQELIRQGLVLLKAAGHGSHHLVVLQGNVPLCEVVLVIDCQTTERNNLHARLDDASGGVAVDRKHLSFILTTPINDGVQSSDDAFRLLLEVSRLFGIGCCNGAANDEQHNDNTFHIYWVFNSMMLVLNYILISLIPVSPFPRTPRWSAFPAGPVLRAYQSGFPDG